MGKYIWPADAVAGAPSYTGRKLRQLLGVFAGAGPSGRPLGAVSGVKPGTPGTTVTATSSTWTVAPHAGVIDGEASAIAGAYLYAFDTNQTGSMTAADATNPRIDLISVQISDPAESDGSSTPDVNVIYTAGVPATSPSAPVTPTRSLALAQINVPQSGGGSPSVTWIAPPFSQLGATTLTDWNNATQPGVYVGVSAANGPATNTYVGIVLRGTGTSATQILTRLSTGDNAEMWMRQYIGSAFQPWKQIYGDTGWLTSGGPAPTAKSGWGSVGCTYRVLNGTLTITITATRTGGTLTMSSSGTLADTDIATVASGYRPGTTMWGYLVASSSAGGCLLGTDGVWTMTDGLPNSTISNGDQVRATFTYPL